MLEIPAPASSHDGREPKPQGAACWGSKISKGQVSSFGKWHRRNAIFAPCSILISLSTPYSLEALGAACRSQKKGCCCFSSPYSHSQLKSLVSSRWSVNICWIQMSMWVNHLISLSLRFNKMGRLAFGFLPAPSRGWNEIQRHENTCNVFSTRKSMWPLVFVNSWLGNSHPCSARSPLPPTCWLASPLI